LSIDCVARVLHVLHETHSIARNFSSLIHKNFVWKTLGEFCKYKKVYGPKRGKYKGPKSKKQKIFWGQNENIKTMRTQVVKNLQSKFKSRLS